MTRTVFDNYTRQMTATDIDKTVTLMGGAFTRMQGTRNINGLVLNMHAMAVGFTDGSVQVFGFN